MYAENAAARAAISKDADGMTRKGSLPEVSISAGFIRSPHAPETDLPTGIEPVKATPWVLECFTRYSPTVPPPETTWNKPLGR